jgi:phosphoenolpyruvate carboxylase
MRGGIETLIGIEAMQNTPLTDEQIARVTAAWPELRNQLQIAAKTANKNVSAKELDNAAMAKILDMLEPPQVASYKDALKYGTGK